MSDPRRRQFPCCFCDQRAWFRVKDAAVTGLWFEGWYSGIEVWKLGIEFWYWDIEVWYLGILNFGVWVLHFGIWVLKFGIWVLIFDIWVFKFGQPTPRGWVHVKPFKVRFWRCLDQFQYESIRRLVSVSLLALQRTPHCDTPANPAICCSASVPGIP